MYPRISEILRSVAPGIRRLLGTLGVLIIIAIGPMAEARSVKRHPGNAIPGGKYMVLLTPETQHAVTGLAASLVATYNLRLLTVWEHIGGFYCEGSFEAATALANDPRVAIVEEDHKLSRQTSAGTTHYLSDQDPALDDLWYLDRIDQRSWAATPRDYNYNMCPTADNTTAYVLDEPVWTEHTAFTGRTVRTVDCTVVENEAPKCVVNQDRAAMCKAIPDYSGLFAASHGTAVASLLTGNITGAARPEIISVAVFRCSSVDPYALTPQQSNASHVVAGLNWIKGDIQNAKSGKPWPGEQTTRTFKPSIVNHSSFLYPWDNDSGIALEAGRQVANENVPYFKSADNFSGDSCAFLMNQYAYTPIARHWRRAFFVVGGSTMDGGVVNNEYMTGTQDVTWKVPPSGSSLTRIQDTGTNLGNCVSGFAPAVQIHAAWNGHGTDFSTPPDPNAYQQLESGTSWSSPIAAALALRWMAQQKAQLGSIPYFQDVYDQLLDDKGDDSPQKQYNATVTATTNSAYTICYNPSNVNDWEYFPDPNHTCSQSTTRTGTFRMPEASNTSGARMVYYSGGTCP